MHVTDFSLGNFRSYEELSLTLAPGINTLIGPNGQGKTNVVEAIDYLSSFSSHRVASDAPLVRVPHQQAVIRASVVKQARSALIEVEINPGKSNRARVNRVALPRARELVGLVRTVFFSPEDLVLVKGDPSERRRFLDQLLTLRSPRFAGVRADYDKVVKQRNALLKAAKQQRRSDEYFDSTLAVWSEKLVQLGAELVEARLALLRELTPLLEKSYAEVAQSSRRREVAAEYQASAALTEGVTANRQTLERDLAESLAARRPEEVERGLSLVGPHRDDVRFDLGGLPVKGYASHGETWSFALALRLASYRLLCGDGDEPILILDDVFAELDSDRRERLAELIEDAEQVLITAAVADDVPQRLKRRTFRVRDGRIDSAEADLGST